MNAALAMQSASFIEEQEMLQAVPSPLQNRLLASLPEDIQQRLFPHLEPCVLQQGSMLGNPHLVSEYLHFPVDCLVSQHCMMADGIGTAMSVVGNDGLIDNDLLMEGGSVPTVSMVQLGGNAFRIPRRYIKDELNRRGRLQTVMFGYFHALLTQMAQTAVCNRHHTLDQQLCRWLLLSVERFPRRSFRITQDQIALSLGVRRQSITEAARKLQKHGVISCFRGLITLMDRDKLEQLTCECYRIVARESHRAWFADAPIIDSSLCANEKHSH
jgi:hypothetical protein